MVLLEELRIENFQSHERTRIVFDPHVTTIVGPSDRGKSAIIRALRWVCLNDLRGDAFMRDGAEFVRVSLLLDGEKVTRLKKGIANAYKKGKEKYVALRSEVPDEIASLINVDAINFQSQHDSPFWFTLSPGQVSRELNAIVDLSVIDATLKNLNGELRDSKTRVEHCEKAAKQAKIDLDTYKFVDKMLSEYEGLVALETELTEASKTTADMRLLYADICYHGEQHERLKAAADAARFLEKSALNALTLRQQCDTLETMVRSHEKATATSQAPDYSKVQEAKKRYSNTTEQVDALRAIIGTIELREKATDTLMRHAHDASVEIDEACEGICPLCEQPLP